MLDNWKSIVCTHVREQPSWRSLLLCTWAMWPWNTSLLSWRPRALFSRFAKSHWHARGVLLRACLLWLPMTMTIASIGWGMSSGPTLVYTRSSKVSVIISEHVIKLDEKVSWKWHWILHVQRWILFGGHRVLQWENAYRLSHWKIRWQCEKIGFFWVNYILISINS